jgi:hypothetical protein
MSTPLAPWTARVLEILADGDWHTYDELVAAAGPLVPPGRSIRTAERVRANLSGRRNDTVKPRTLQWAEPVDAGRRRIVIDSVIQLSRRQGRPLEFDGPRRARRVRMRATP